MVLLGSSIETIFEIKLVLLVGQAFIIGVLEVVVVMVLLLGLLAMELMELLWGRNKDWDFDLLDNGVRMGNFLFNNLLIWNWNLHFFYLNDWVGSNRRGKV